MPIWVRPEVEFYHADVRIADDITKALQGVRYVFHLAAYGGFVPSISKYMDVNATGTLRLFEAIRDSGKDVKKVVVASSQGIYGEGKYVNRSGSVVSVGTRRISDLDRAQWDPLDPTTGEALQPSVTPESHPHNSSHVYSISKYAQERAALAMGYQLGVPTCCLRFAVTYGPRQSPHNPYTGVVAIFSTQILNGLNPLPYEDGQQTRDFIYVSDVARGALIAMEDERTSGRVLNLGTGTAMTIDRLARTLAQTYSKPELVPVYRGYYRPSDVRHLVLDPEQMARLGFRSTVTVTEGLRDVANWLRSTHDAIPERFRAAEEQLLRLGVVRESHGHR
jgi:dTDP-L-rhamnose 4-epimerase